MKLSMKRITLPLAGIAMALIALVAWQGVQADAGNPITASIHGEIVVNANGTATVFVRGEWNWLSHNKDCNVDRNGTGVGMVWNDPSEAGFTVTKGAISAGVGVAALRGTADDDGATGTVPANTLDRMVHPVDRGNQATDTYKDINGVTQHDTNAPQPGPAGQSFVDPIPAGITTTQLNAWRGGCGRVPITTPCGINNDAIGDPCGSWGYEKTYTDSNGNPQVGYAHTYASRKDITVVCANFYDVHGSNAGFQAPNGTKEITVNGNGDNSIQTNAFDVTNGANCISFPQSDADVQKTADAPSVNAGEQIGFVIKVNNNSAVTDATGVQITDNLPGNAVADSINWSVVADGSGNCTAGAGSSASSCNVTGFTGAGACTIGGSPPTQTLTCNVGTVPKSTSSFQFVVHVVSQTAFTDASHNSCNNGNNGTYTNTATLTSTSQDAKPTSPPASTQVLCPDLHITKTADNTDVVAGDQIGFNIHLVNQPPAPGTAKNVTINDGLPVCPAQFNCSWSVVSVTPSGGKVLPPNPCSIAPASGPGAQTLSCSFGDLAPGQDVDVHVTSPTTFDGSACKAPSTINNPVALGSATNNPPVQDSEGLTLECPSTTLDKNIKTITVDYEILDTNDGNVALSNPTVDDPVCQNSSPPSTPVQVLKANGKNFGDANNNGLLDPGETFKFTCTAVFDGTTGVKTNTAIAHGTTPSGRDVTYCVTPPNSTTLCDPDERASATVTVP